MTAPDIPSVDEIRENRRRLGARVERTPMIPWRGDRLASASRNAAEVFLKLELLQHTGTFKLRGALTSVDALSETQRRGGVAAMSGGNHAIAVAYAARLGGVSAKVVMPKTASPIRRRLCESYGAEVVEAETIQECFQRIESIAADEGRTIIHPFEGRNIALGTATLGLEICEQLPDVEAVIVPIGGGGLAAGVACAVKQINPDCQVFGIEPEGAPSMRRSFDEGRPVTLDAIATIADSLASPSAQPYSFDLCRRFLDDVRLVSDNDLRRAMGLLFSEMKLGVEPATAAATAGYLGPLNDVCAGKKVCIIACGANIDADLMAAHIKAAGSAG